MCCAVHHCSSTPALNLCPYRGADCLPRASLLSSRGCADDALFHYSSGREASYRFSKKTPAESQPSCSHLDQKLARLSFYFEQLSIFTDQCRPWPFLPCAQTHCLILLFEILLILSTPVHAGQLYQRARAELAVSFLSHFKDMPCMRIQG